MQVEVQIFHSIHQIGRHRCSASVMTVWQKYLPTRIMSPVGEVKVTETALSQEMNLGVLK